VGIQPESGNMILAGIGRFGPYLKVGTEYTSLGEDDDILTIGLNRAVAVIREKPKRKRAEPLRELGAHPDDGKPVNIFKGRYGPYVKHGRINASLPKSVSEDELTLAMAVTLIAARAANAGSGNGRAKSAKAAKGGKAKKSGGAKKRSPRKAKTQPKEPADA